MSLDRCAKVRRWLDFRKVLAFLDACWIDQFAAYGNDPDEDAPTICSERYAINILKLTEVFRLRGAFSPTPEYEELRGTLVGRLTSVPQFVSSCVDNEDRVCHSYPLSVIKVWNTPVETGGADAVERRSLADQLAADGPFAVKPYRRADIKAEAEHFGRLLELHIRGHSHESIAAVLQADAHTIARELRQPKLTIRTSPHSLEIVWDDLGLPGRFDWQLTRKGLEMLRGRSSS